MPPRPGPLPRGSQEEGTAVVNADVQGTVADQGPGTDP